MKFHNDPYSAISFKTYFEGYYSKVPGSDRMFHI